VLLIALAGLDAVGAICGYLLLAGALAGQGEPLWASAVSLIDGTSFGLPWLIRIGLALTLFACVLVRVPALGVTVLAGALLATDGWNGHAAVGGPLAQAVQIIHVLAIAGWFGGLIGLLLELDQAQPTRALFLLRRFTGMGIAFVVLMVGSGIANAWQLLADALGGPPGPYFSWLALKLFFVAIMLACAALNRFWFALVLQHGAKAVPAGLPRCVALELAVGVLAVAAVSVLGTLSPA
jgi:putative copper resistance protein D